jgi:hypothetical protein
LTTFSSGGGSRGVTPGHQSGSPRSTKSCDRSRWVVRRRGSFRQPDPRPSHEHAGETLGRMSTGCGVSRSLSVLPSRGGPPPPPQTDGPPPSIRRFQSNRRFLLTPRSRRNDTGWHKTTPDGAGRDVEPGSVPGCSNLRIRCPKGRGSSTLPSRTSSENGDSSLSLSYPRVVATLLDLPHPKGKATHPPA